MHWLIIKFMGINSKNNRIKIIKRSKIQNEIMKKLGKYTFLLSN